MTNILVTGASGFIGRDFVPRALRDGYAVRALVRRAGSAPPGSDEYVIGDLGGSSVLTGALRGVDVIVHLAGRAHVLREIATEPLGQFRAVNRDATLHLAEAAVQAGVGRFVFVSSIGVLGPSTTEVPFGAGSVPNPVGPYAHSKWEAEQGLLAMSDRIETVVIRPPLVHGSGVGGNLHRLLAHVHRGLPLPLGSVRNRRTLVGVRNLSDLLCVSIKHPAAAGGVFLAGDDESISTPELVREMGRNLRRRARLLPVPVWVLRGAGLLTGRSDDVLRLTGSLEVDISATVARLGWKPPFTLAEGIAEMCSHYLTALQGSPSGTEPV